MSAPRTLGKIVHPLHGNQMHAVDPDRTVWLSASAGTGKTQVLTSRVLRLLLQPDVEPDQILCLTFTKAGAAEMATRIGEKLADWVRMDDVTLATHLQAIGAPFDPVALDRARSRFAAVLDCPGGGLRIETIHAFSQWLLSAFPEEAGLRPGARAMEDRDRDLLFREVLIDLLVRAESAGDEAFIDALAALSLRMGESDLAGFLLRCASAQDLWTGPGGWQPPLRPRINRLLGLPADADRSMLAAHFTDRAFPVVSLSRCLDALRGWATKTADGMIAPIATWLAASPEERAVSFDALERALFTKESTPKYAKNLEKQDPDYVSHAEDVGEALEAVRDLVRAFALADLLDPALTVGCRFARAWQEAKDREGFIDFDDQIRAAAALLTERAPADWIRFKLDRRFDHVLVDEAQDTNAAQWRIVLDGLTGDFFTGAGKETDGARTLFVVGDYKQAIFRFQGTSPENFDRARRRVENELLSLARMADDPTLELLDLGLGRSFRSSQTILSFVDRAIAGIGPARLGLAAAPELHEGQILPGLVTLWQPVGLGETAELGAEDDTGGDEGWLAGTDRELAARIARQVRQWLDEGFSLSKGRHRRATPGDVMILVRKRGDLAGLIVARLHAEGVPVAGVDRLRLGAPLAVKDMIAALTFCVQPGDDLNLAGLLVSPLIGWSQQDLLAHGYRGKGVPLWDHLRATENAQTHGALTRLRELLSRADFAPPAALLTWILVGPWQGRKALVARLGAEANDPIDELLNAAMAYATAHVPSLAGFLHWFAAGDGDVKREAGGNADLVRVMTVHGSKGLQAPIVILADAADDPGKSRPAPVVLMDDGERAVPLPPLRKDEKPLPVRSAEEIARREEREEHWRLLYVAMTRAEEALFVTGSLGPRDKGEVPEESWYAELARLLPTDGGLEDPIWTRRWEEGALAPLPPKDPATGPAPSVVLPDELVRAIAPEPRPLRPLAPSALGEDEAPAPPTRPGPGARNAARRGTLLHRLLERLPDLAPEARAASAMAWVRRMATDLPENEQAGLVDAALAVLTNPEWQDVFGPGSLAEVPIAALVGPRLINGTIDRLLITAQAVRIVDFKTDRRPPEDLDAIPTAYLRQMAAYVAAMRVIHPGKRVEAALLYTATPRLFALPDELLAAQKLGLAETEESFSG
ncbi:UvrD/REP helicase [Novosphingobium nitrogenifigens DSM 19370]|uniref:DNA 3'-5' helicase n=1 Tax=Novosphingobium nitrogenifigens DSM 19370 TaxID=983920 RepID=F1Z9R0_9SPHN|nr:double-strand break repair helicase AddA [Novosphingobium nitrogenifigens]EGD58682.1 UvrD/REP helicase [Novosphingobium nitrogenifigens DSM 19370]